MKAYRHFHVYAAVAAILLTISTLVLGQGVTSAPRGEYPTPQFQRAAWKSLNGEWSFAFDDNDEGLTLHWDQSFQPLAKRIIVPFAFETKLSGIGDTSMHDVIWYRRSVQVPVNWKSQRILLHFGAVNYRTTVWVNGQQCGEHEGGQTPFTFDITDVLRAKKNTLTVRVEFPSRDRTIPRGKQYWEPQTHTIWYDRTEGISQPVWLEPVPAVHLASIRMLPDAAESTVRFEAVATGPQDGSELHAHVSMKGVAVAEGEVSFIEGRAQLTLKIANKQLWTPAAPNLYDVTFSLTGRSGENIDKVYSYFGERSIGTHAGVFTLNGAPYYLRMVLDQGYWPESLLTAPTDAAFRNDVLTIKQMGFNGVRLHQKVEDPRFLYWADRLGLAVWSEMANAQDYTPAYAMRMTREWADVVAANLNHPSIVAWVPLNESWGVRGVTAGTPLAAHMQALYFLTHSLDPTRPVVDNDGWEHSNTTDLLTLHDYTGKGAALRARYAGLGDNPVEFPAAQHLPLLADAKYNGQPILLTEFGGVAFRPSTSANASDFGYAAAAKSGEQFATRVTDIVDGVLAVPQFAGYCYTQFSDVEQEVNGLVTFDRKPKLPLTILNAIFGRDPANTAQPGQHNYKELP
jgi:beta-galactosidase/beta-glucuronidase